MIIDGQKTYIKINIRPFMYEFLNELKKYSDRKLIIACNMGQHSASAGTMLRKNGFDNVSRLSGGITEWRGQNLPLVKS